MPNNHTKVARGKRVLLILHDGRRLIDIFIERTSRNYLFKILGKVAIEDVRSLSIKR